MKKIILAIVSLIALVAAFFPVFVGLKIKSELTDTMEIISQQSGYQITEIRYDLGWISSKAVYELELKFLESIQEANDLEIE